MPRREAARSAETLGRRPADPPRRAVLSYDGSSAAAAAGRLCPKVVLVRRVSVTEAQRPWARLVAAGEVAVIARHGKPAAQLTPPGARRVSWTALPARRGAARAR